MISFHHIDRDRLDDLIRFSGGSRCASRVLGVTPTQLETWKRTATVPQCALRLLWLLAPEGTAMFNHEINERLVCVGRLNEALQGSLQRAEAESARMRCAYQAQIQHLTAENQLLRSLISNPGLSEKLGRLSAELQTIADVLPDHAGREMAYAMAIDQKGAPTAP